MNRLKNAIKKINKTVVKIKKYVPKDIHNIRIGHSDYLDWNLKHIGIGDVKYINLLF